MQRITKGLVVLGAVGALAGVPSVAAAKHGADDPVTHVRHSGADDGANHDRNDDNGRHRSARRALINGKASYAFRPGEVPGRHAMHPSEQELATIKIDDKRPFQEAVKTVWEKYGKQHSELIKRIQDTK